MDYFLTWGHSPWGQQILTHLSWNLLWASLFAGVAFLLAHASYMVLSAHRKRHPAETDAMEAMRPNLPARIARHSLPARLFHWVMAASMFTLLFTAFLPIAGVKFAWVTCTGWAASCFGVDRVPRDSRNLLARLLVIWVGSRRICQSSAPKFCESLGHDVAGPQAGKYPLVTPLPSRDRRLRPVGHRPTGLTMMVRILTPLFTRTPYL